MPTDLLFKKYQMWQFLFSKLFCSSTDDEEELDDIGSESSDDSTRIGRRRGEPVRRSTRARVSRYDREFSKCCICLMHTFF